MSSVLNSVHNVETNTVRNAAILTQVAKKDLWYKEPWLLLVVGGPLIVVFASLLTGFIAFRGADQVVAKDYYKQGLMINTNLQRDAKARELQLQASMRLNLEADKVEMDLQSRQVLPETVQMSLAVSGAQSGAVEEIVRRVALIQIAPGKYAADLKQGTKANTGLDMRNMKLMHVKLETNDWRLTGDWYDPMQRNLLLSAAK